MIKEAINRVLELGKANIIETIGEVYSDKQLHPVRPHTNPTQDAICIHTLSGVVDWLASDEGIEARSSGCTVHISDYNRVDVFSLVGDYYRDRHQYVTAKFKPDAFVFDRYHSQEDFIINASSKFVMDQSLKALLKMVSSIQLSETIESSDDGVSQNVVIKNELKRKQEAKVEPFHDLAPYRTFREISQPVSRFLVRTRNDGGGVPTIALFEADNAQWKIDAMERIRNFLSTQMYSAIDEDSLQKINIIM